MVQGRLGVHVVRDEGCGDGVVGERRPNNGLDVLDGRGQKDWDRAKMACDGECRQDERRR